MRLVPATLIFLATTVPLLAQTTADELQAIEAATGSRNRGVDPSAS